MRPDLNDYHLLYMNHTYFVLDPYDLMTMPALKIIGWGITNIDEAEGCLHALFKHHTKEYERLKSIGRSFPDND